MKFNITSYKRTTGSGFVKTDLDDCTTVEGDAYTDVGIVSVYAEVSKERQFQVLSFNCFYKGRHYYHHDNDNTILGKSHLSRMAREFAAEVVRAAGEAGR